MTKPKVSPPRKCIVCRRLVSRDQLLRMVSDKASGQLVPNPKGRLEGKGCYVCRFGNCVGRLRTDKKMRKVFGAHLSEETFAWLTSQSQPEAPPPAPDRPKPEAQSAEPE